MLPKPNRKYMNIIYIFNIYKKRIFISLVKTGLGKECDKTPAMCGPSYI